METVLIVIHLMVVFALVVVVLLQRSEGGALGMGGGGGGGGGGGFMSARGAANALTKVTAVLAASFFATSIALAIISGSNESSSDFLDNVPTTQGEGGASILDQITPESEKTAPVDDANPAEPSVPTGN